MLRIEAGEEVARIPKMAAETDLRRLMQKGTPLGQMDRLESVEEAGKA
jgi:hypothetical protein